MTDPRRIQPGEAYVVYPDGNVRPLDAAAQADQQPISMETAPAMPEAFLTETVEATRLAARPRV